MLADTLGATVLVNNITGNGVWHPLSTSNTINVQVPGTPVVVQEPATKLPAVGMGTLKVLVGGTKAYCNMLLALVALAAHKVVVFTGEAQPSVKLVELVALNVAKA